jgi:hypothetical protein
MGFAIVLKRQFAAADHFMLGNSLVVAIIGDAVAGSLVPKRIVFFTRRLPQGFPRK